MSITPICTALRLATDAKAAADQAASHQLFVALNDWARRVLYSCKADDVPGDVIDSWDVEALLKAMWGTPTVDRLIGEVASSLKRAWHEQHQLYHQAPPWRVESYLIHPREELRGIRIVRLDEQTA